MKRVVSLLISVLMMFSAVNVCGEEEIESVMYVLSENFDSLSDTSSITSLSVYPKTNRFSIQDVFGNSDKALMYEALTESDMYFDASVNVNGNLVFVEFDIMYEDKDFDNGEFLLCFKDSGGNEVEICHFDSAGALCLANGQVVSRVVPGKFYSICAGLNLESKKVDIYVNHKKKASQASMNSDTFVGMATVRAHLYRLDTGEKPVIYIDDFSVYEAKMPIFKYEERGINMSSSQELGKIPSVADEDSVLTYMENTIALYVGQNKIAIDGEAELIDSSNKNVKTFVKDDRAFVPVRFVTEALGYNVKWSDDDRVVNISDGETTVSLKVDSDVISVNGADVKIDTAPVIDNDRVFVPVRAVCEAFGKKLTYDKSGLIVIADRDNFFDMRNDLGIFRTLAGSLVFDQPSGREMVEMLKTNYPDNAHPRIHFNQARLDEIKKASVTDPNMINWKEDVLQSADDYYSLDVLDYEIPDGIRLLDVCHAAWERIETLSFAYLISDDAKYADRAIEEMLNVCSFKDWNPYHFLDTAEMMRGVATGYDWLYNYMGEQNRIDDRNIIKNSLRDMGLKQILEDYDDVEGRRRTWKWAQSAEPDNWNLVCNGSAVLAALAIADEEEEIAARVLEGGMKLIQKAILLYGPDGAWYEGPGYWDYATTFYVGFMSSVYSVFGKTFGYMETPGVAQTGYYINALSGYLGVFNFHDSVCENISSPTLFFLSNMLNDPSIAQLRLDFMAENYSKGSTQDMIWYDTSMTNADVTMPKDYYYRDTEVATMRSNWNGAGAIMTGMHSGKINVYHGHMDAGQFIIDAYGTRYAIDVGQENYNIKDSVWNLYRYRAEGHNTLVINPSGDGGQLLSGEPKIDRFESGDSSAYAISDLTSAYKNQAQRVKRGLKLTNNRSMIIIQDEFSLTEPSKVQWFMHTGCDVEVAQDGKSARVKGKYRDMLVYLLEDVDGVFSVMDAVPLPTSPTNNEQNKNLGIRKLCFTMDNVIEDTIPIGFSFVISGDNGEDVYRPEVTALDNWTLDHSEAKELPRLTGLKINGEPFERFSPEDIIYNYRMVDGEDIPVVMAESDDNVEITYPEKVPGIIKIAVSSKLDPDVKEIYAISLTQEILSSAPLGYKTLSISSVDATATPQPENSAPNAIDGDLSTRWSATGVESLIFDLGSVQNVSAIGLAVYQDTTNDGRQQYFKVLLSENGTDYAEVFAGNSTGTTLEKELFPFDEVNARYIKLECSGTSVGTWNSITEFSAYGPDDE